MNLDKLFQAQKELREHINYNGEDRFEKLVLALLVEIGECANEWRGFKFWSTDQEPRATKKEKCPTCKGNGVLSMGKGTRGLKVCPDCDNPRGGMKTTNPLLEEYVDGLHFVLELGVELEIDLNDWVIGEIIKFDVVEQFICLNQSVTDLWEASSDLQLITILEHYLGLGKLLGFTGEQIEQGYFVKNQVNHERQESGY